MEVVVINGHSDNASLLRKMYQLRADIFSKRLGWSVRADKGLEFDEFDAPQTRYILVIFKHRVVGCARFLDFAGPTMVGTHFSSLVDDPTALQNDTAIESSRFCVDTERLQAEDGVLGTQATKVLISAMIRWAALHQYQKIITVTDVAVERLLRRLEVPFTRLGSPQRIENTRAIAGIVDIDAALCSTSVPPPCAAVPCSHLAQAPAL